MLSVSCVVCCVYAILPCVALAPSVRVLFCELSVCCCVHVCLPSHVLSLSKAHVFACHVGATHLVMTPVFHRYFLSSDDETLKQLSRRKKQKKHLLEDTKDLPWSVDPKN